MAASATAHVGRVEVESHAALQDEIARLRDGWLAASEAHREERRHEQVEREGEQRAHRAALEALAKQLDEARRREQVEREGEQRAHRAALEALAKQLDEARRREQVEAVREGAGHASELQAARAAHQVTKQGARALQVQLSASEAHEAMLRSHVLGQGTELEHAHAQLRSLSHTRRLEPSFVKELEPSFVKELEPSFVKELEQSLRLEVRDVRSELGGARLEVEGLRRMVVVMVRLLHGARQRLRELEVLFGGLAVSQPGMSRNAIAAVNRASDSEAASATKLLLSSEIGQMLDQMLESMV